MDFKKPYTYNTLVNIPHLTVDTGCIDIMCQLLLWAHIILIYFGPVCVVLNLLKAFIAYCTKHLCVYLK